MATLRNRKIVFASVLAATSGVGTLCYANLAILSENAFVAALQMTAGTLLFPGLIGAVAVSGNVHVYSFWVAAPINAFIYFGLGWIGYSLAHRFKTRS
jgi:hypothetical protein